ncbi:HupE/UreJ family protein [Neogemmobacter tilapiae]|uniref:Urease accessory protein n=1 Tax=Neogemmobacter tilapiae TaxID=875041 RepID=A0A918TSU0_9RHOB|nr:HupE/UreJ family protein [Gemmobacter tilapiae]GHC61366.1 urease accessory protein [Gemmobacter tilapiae]
MKKLILLAMLLPTTALAHGGHVEGSAFMAGLGHPVGGLDHVLAMVAVGLWAAVTGGRAIWAMPVAFVLAMLAGGALGMAGLPMPGVEPMIVASIVLLGVAAALAFEPPLVLALAGIAVFGVAHGHAHGAEGPGAGMGLYALGFALSTAGLHLAGLAAGFGLVKIEQRMLARAAGGAVGLGGMALAMGVIG